MFPQKSAPLWAQIVCALSALILLGGCGDKQGEPGQKCYPNGTCNTDNQCVNGYCVPADGKAGEAAPEGAAGVAADPKKTDATARQYPASFDAFSPDLWKVGNRWVYRYTRDAKSSRDKVGEAYYYLEREVTDVRQGSELTVVMKERGGPHDDHVRLREFKVTDTCIRYDPRKKKLRDIFCLGGPLESIRQDEMDFKVSRHDAGKGLETAFDPLVGLVSLAQPGWKKRPERWELIGYSVAGHQGGRHEMIPLTCDWDNSLVLPISGGEGDKKTVKIPLSGKHGFREVVGWTGYKTVDEWDREVESRGGARFVPVEGKTRYVKRSMQLHRAKAWLAADGSSEYVVLHYEEWDRGRVDVYRLQFGSVKRQSFTFDKPEATDPQKDKFASLMKAHGESCYIRILWKAAKPAKSADYTMIEDVLRRRGGALAISESGTVNVDW